MSNTQLQSMTKPVAPNMPAANAGLVVRRKCACAGAANECEQCNTEDFTLRRSHSNAQLQPREFGLAPEIVHEVLSSPGQPLDAQTRTFMEPRFGHHFDRLNVWPGGRAESHAGLRVGSTDDPSEREADRLAVSVANQNVPDAFSPAYDFSGVRVHHDARAAASARAVGALAYTVGNNIVFDSGYYAPSTSTGRTLLAHELTHVVQQHGPGASVIRRQTPPAKPGTGGPPVPSQCDGQRDITADFRQFVADVPALLASSTSIDPAEQANLAALSDQVLHSEGVAQIDTFTILACDKISLTVGTFGETFLAYFDPNAKTVGMLTQIEALMKEFRDKKEKGPLVEFLRTIAHEKRHATLAGAASVPVGGLQPALATGPMAISDAQQAGYRVEEILTKAEEISVSRRAEGGSYRVPEVEQTTFQRSWQMVRDRVTDSELARLRGVVINQMRSRFGFNKGCDNALTLGVVAAMESGRWHMCGGGKVQTPIPAGLNVCEVDGKNPICPALSEIP